MLQSSQQQQRNTHGSDQESNTHIVSQRLPGEERERGGENKKIERLNRDI